ncbi:MAG: dihydrolipoyllysine-residue acetyltransferase [Gammaproteobacteria bacterium]|nr:dihydrolipoyllysine-residue acetyltransferase [Gammaproteobacteria bacterium]
MANAIAVKVPDIGDFSDVEIIEVLVQPGQQVEAEDGLITLETDKAVMDVPAPQAGTVVNVEVAVGDRVSEGDLVLTLEAANAADDTAVASVTGTTTSEPEAAGGEKSSPTGDTSQSTTDETVTLVDIPVPDLGDFDAVEVIEVLVEPGDQVELESPVVTLETDKAAMDVPSPVVGVIKEVLVSPGDHVSKGTVLARCESRGTPSDDAGTTTDEPPPPAGATASTASETTSMPTAAGAVPATLPAIDESTFKVAHASPAVRKFARELGVDLGRVRGTGVKSRIRKDDVKAFVKAIMMGDVATAAAGPAWPAVPKVDHAKYGEIEEQPLTRIQKISGPRLHASWVNIPHVTHNDQSDFTDTEKIRKEMKAEAAEEGISLTPLAFVLRGCVLALQEMPLLNCSLSDDGDALIMKKYINLGFAADTPNGLVVPVIHNAQDLSVLEIARQLGDLSAQAREGKLPIKKMQGSTFTISSLGGIGGTSFTPIVNAPEVAILGVSRANMTPVYIEGEFQPRLMLPLSLSYDHRVIDGANAARFCVLLAKLLADPKGLVV